mmetsp:Transcript_5252/g.7757  ORF Transcript_5252/g.7757 Transcript_5252/m.7757 type:complete len:461 (+) Transcript_5252:38-1420(+)
MSNLDEEEEVYLTSSKKRKEAKKKKKKLIKKGIRIAMLCISCILCVLLIIITMAFLKRGRESYRMIENSVLLISIDGFRHSYLEEYKDQLGNINEYFLKNGVRSKGMKPIYPSKTFPNHWTLVTGLYAESHGIVANHMYDPVFNTTFSLNTEESFKPRWWNGESIWETAKKKNIKSGVCFWPGSEVKGKHPDIYERFDQKMPSKTRVEKIIEYFKMSYEKRPQFLAVYFDEVDTAGHDFGPGSKEVKEAIVNVDKAIGLLMNWLKTELVDEFIDIIITSDHGMTATNDKVYYVKDYIPAAYHSRLRIENAGPLMDISLINYSRDRAEDRTIMETIKESIESANLEGVYIMEKYVSIPEKYHYEKNRRIAPLLLRMKLGYTMLKNRGDWVGKGNHGYDNTEEDMQAIFLARGPSFILEGKEMKNFPNVNIYPLLAHLLKVNPAPNNGTIEVFKDILKKDSK